VDNFLPLVLALVKIKDKDTNFGLIEKTLRERSLDNPTTKLILGNALIIEVLTVAYLDALDGM
jgi:hypothetical protein